jgi:hypothetical protein
MKRRTETPDLAVLRQQWQHWTAIVESYARRRRTRHQVGLKDYNTLHRKLRATCRRLARANGTQKPGLFVRLEELVCPWLTTGTLEQADGDILWDLLNRCQHAGRELGVGRFAWLGHGAKLLLLGLAAVLAAILGVGVLFRFRTPLEDAWWTVSYAVKDSSPIQQVSVAGVLGILFAMYLLSRTARS